MNSKLVLTTIADVNGGVAWADFVYMLRSKHLCSLWSWLCQLHWCHSHSGVFFFLKQSRNLEICLILLKCMKFTLDTRNKVLTITNEIS